MVLDVIHPKHVLKQEFKALEMNFLCELNLFDIVEVHANENKDFFTVTKDGKVCFALVLEK